MEPATKTLLLSSLVLAMFGIAVQPADAMGSLILGIFGASTSAFWTKVSTRQVFMTYACGFVLTVMVLIEHDRFLTSISPQVKSFIAGASGYVAVSFFQFCLEKIKTQFDFWYDWLAKKFGG